MTLSSDAARPQSRRIIIGNSPDLTLCNQSVGFDQLDQPKSISDTSAPIFPILCPRAVRDLDNHLPKSPDKLLSERNYEPTSDEIESYLPSPKIPTETSAKPTLRRVKKIHIVHKLKPAHKPKLAHKLKPAHKLKSLHKLKPVHKLKPLLKIKPLHKPTTPPQVKTPQKPLKLKTPQKPLKPNTPQKPLKLKTPQKPKLPAAAVAKPHAQIPIKPVTVLPLKPAGRPLTHPLLLHPPHVPASLIHPPAPVVNTSAKLITPAAKHPVPIPTSTHPKSLPKVHAPPTAGAAVALPTPKKIVSPLLKVPSTITPTHQVPITPLPGVAAKLPQAVQPARKKILLPLLKAPSTPTTIPHAPQSPTTPLSTVHPATTLASASQITRGPLAAVSAAAPPTPKKIAIPVLKAPSASTTTAQAPHVPTIPLPVVAANVPQQSSTPANASQTPRGPLTAGAAAIHPTANIASPLSNASPQPIAQAPQTLSAPQAPLPVVLAKGSHLSGSASASALSTAKGSSLAGAAVAPTVNKTTLPPALTITPPLPVVLAKGSHLSGSASASALSTAKGSSLVGAAVAPTVNKTTLPPALTITRSPQALPTPPHAAPQLPNIPASAPQIIPGPSNVGAAIVATKKIVSPLINPSPATIQVPSTTPSPVQGKVSHQPTYSAAANSTVQTTAFSYQANGSNVPASGPQITRGPPIAAAALPEPQKTASLPSQSSSPPVTVTQVSKVPATSSPTVEGNLSNNSTPPQSPETEPTAVASVQDSITTSAQPPVAEDPSSPNNQTNLNAPIAAASPQSASSSSLATGGGDGTTVPGPTALNIQTVDHSIPEQTALVNAPLDASANSTLVNDATATNSTMLNSTVPTGINDLGTGMVNDPTALTLGNTPAYAGASGPSLAPIGAGVSTSVPVSTALNIQTTDQSIADQSTPSINAPLDSVNNPATLPVTSDFNSSDGTISNGTMITGTLTNATLLNGTMLNSNTSNGIVGIGTGTVNDLHGLKLGNTPPNVFASAPSNRTGAAVGGVFGCLALIALALGVFLSARRRQTNKVDNGIGTFLNAPSNGTAPEMTQVHSGTESQNTTFSPDDPVTRYSLGGATLFKRLEGLTETLNPPASPTRSTSDDDPEDTIPTPTVNTFNTSPLSLGQLKTQSAANPTNAATLPASEGDDPRSLPVLSDSAGTADNINRESGGTSSTFGGGVSSGYQETVKFEDGSEDGHGEHTNTDIQQPWWGTENPQSK